LRHKESGKLVHYFNTHYDGGAQWEREASQQIIRKAEALPEGVRIATADFNFTPNSFGWHSMRSYFNCVRETLAPDNNQATLNCYEVQGDKLSWVIDFCFYHGALQPTKYEIITRLYDGKFPSDHYGMVYDFKFED
jgi:endonuclease/exonuclease/phosphatase family metal-dependent hydrolase